MLLFLWNISLNGILGCQINRARLLVEEVVSWYGVLEQLMSNRGADFLSDLISKLYGIDKVKMSRYHPQMDRIVVEKFNDYVVNV